MCVCVLVCVWSCVCARVYDLVLVLVHVCPCVWRSPTAGGAQGESKGMGSPRTGGA